MSSLQVALDEPAAMPTTKTLAPAAVGKAAPAVPAARPATAPGSAPRVAAPVKKGWRVFDAREISLFQADAKYTTFVVHGREYMISESLHALEERLAEYGFMRVHRGTLVNLSMVRSVHRRGRQTLLVLTTNFQVLVSRRHAHALADALGMGAGKKRQFRKNR